MCYGRGMKRKRFDRIAAALFLLLSLTGCTRRELPPPGPMDTPEPSEATAPAGPTLPGMIEVTDSTGETLLLPRSKVLTPFAEQLDAKRVRALASGAYYDGDDWSLRGGMIECERKKVAI